MPPTAYPHAPKAITTLSSCLILTRSPTQFSVTTPKLHTLHSKFYISILPISYYNMFRHFTIHSCRQLEIITLFLICLVFILLFSLSPESAVILQISHLKITKKFPLLQCTIQENSRLEKHSHTGHIHNFQNCTHLLLLSCSLTSTKVTILMSCSFIL